MAIVIEDLQADVAQAASAPAPAPAAPAADSGGGDERKVLETIALETWAMRRLIAD
jgi:hypothetical protein